MVAAHHGAAFIGRFGGDVAEGFQAARVNQSREHQARAQRALRGGIALRHQVIEFAAAIARRGDAGGEQRGAELYAGEVGVHFPQSGQQRLALCVDYRHAARNGDRGARAGGRDAAIAHDHDGILDRRAAGGVDQRGAGDGVGAGSFRRHRTAERREIRHLLRDARAEKLRQRGFVFGAHGFHGQSAGERHGRRELPFGVHPQDFAAEHQVGGRVAFERYRFAVYGNGIAPRKRNFHGWGAGLRAQHGQLRRLSVRQPIPHHGHLDREGRGPEDGEITRGKIGGSGGAGFVDGGRRRDCDFAGRHRRFVGDRSVVGRHAQRRFGGPLHAAVGVLGRCLERETARILRDLVAFFADRMQDHVDREGPRFGVDGAENGCA